MAANENILEKSKNYCPLPDATAAGNISDLNCSYNTIPRGDLKLANDPGQPVNFTSLQSTTPPLARYLYFLLVVKSLIMKRVAVTITFVSLYALIYHLASYTGIPDNVIIFMFLMSPFLVLYMVYVILKYGKPSAHTFDERYYDDVEDTE